MGTKCQRGGLNGVDRIAEIGLHEHDLADGARLDHRPRMLRGGKEPGPDGVLQHDATFFRRRVHGSAVCPSLRQRLFAQHVFAGLNGEDAVLFMQSVDGSDVDDIDLRRRHHLGVASVRRSDTVLFGKLACAIRRTRGDGGHRGAGTRVQTHDPLGGDRTCADDAPAQWKRHIGGIGSADANVSRRRWGKGGVWCHGISCPLGGWRSDHTTSDTVVTASERMPQVRSGA